MHIDQVNTTLNAKIFSNAHTPFMVQEMHTTTCIFIKYYNHEINFIAMHLTSSHPYIKPKVLHPCTSPGGRPTQRPHFTIEAKCRRPIISNRNYEQLL